MKRRRRSHRRGKNHTVRNIVISCFVITFLFATGYSAFQTVIGINAKGNIKDLKQEVDSKVPTNDLLFWGQADNSENTLTTLKDKSSHANDGILNNFNNTFTSGYNDGELVFDGIDDYVDLGYSNYNFNNTVSLVAYVKLNEERDGWPKIFSNQGDYKGMTIDMYKNLGFLFYVYNGQSTLTNGDRSGQIDKTKFYTVIGIYDNDYVSLYLDGKLISTRNGKEKLVSSTRNMYIGASPERITQTTNFSCMTLKEALIYDRALTETEVKTITDGFNRKYKKNTMD